MARGSYFVGIGAQRSGTTWLGHYLRRQAGIRFSPLKEVRFFDAVSIPGHEHMMLGWLNTKLAVLGIGRYGVSHPLSGAILAWHYLGIRKMREQSYRAYFRELARHGHLAGEISPSYAALDVAAISRIEDLLERPKYFFIMRNPVDRLISEYSFRSTRAGVRPLSPGRDIDESLLLLSEQSHHRAYSRTVERYEQVAGAARLHLMFTEDLFDATRTQSVCDGLCDFLGIERAPAPIGAEVNRAPELEVAPELRARLVNGMRREYELAAERFGPGLPPSWLRDLDMVGRI